MLRKFMKTSIIAVLLTVALLMASAAGAVSYTDYPYNVGVNVWAWDAYGFYQSECVSYVAWRLNSTNGVAFHNSKNPYTGANLPANIVSDGVAGVWGHAKDWVNAAQYCGCVIDTNPAPGAVYWSGSGTYGHVAWVSEVRAGNKVVIEQYNGGIVKINGEWYGNHEFSAEEFTAGSKGEKYIHIKDLPTDRKLDINGYLDNAEAANTTGYATFDVYVNGQRKADDVSDFCQTFPSGSSYEIKDIKVASGKAFDGYSSRTLGGFVSGGRSGTLNSNVDVRLTLHTVDAALFNKNHKPAQTADYNGHSYYFYSTPATWYGAEIVAEYLGGHLVTITNSGENEFVKGLIGDSACWIGLTDKDKEGTWKWVSGEDFSYSNWGSGQPDNSTGGGEGAENFAHIWANQSTWNDNAGYVSYPFVVEIDGVYTVSYDANEGTNPPDSQVKIHGNTLKLTTGIPNRSGYEFLHWNTKADDSGTTYAPGANYSTNADVTLYAIWKDLTYTIMYDANGGKGAPANQIVTGGGTATLSSDVPYRLGHDFKGWDPDINATIATYQPGDSYTGEDVTLHAIWEIQHFNVTFNSEGAGSVPSRTVDYGNPLGELPEPQREGYFFKGWYNDNTKVTASTVVTSNMLLTAHWSEPSKMVLPSPVTTVEDEAFEGVSTNVFVIPGGVTAIGSKAFANNPDLYSVIIYADNVTPASDAFANCPNLTIYAHENSQIHYYAVAKKIPFVPLTSGTSDWVPYSEMPIGASVVQEKWSYDHIITETTTSTSPTMEGWTENPALRQWEQTETGVNKYAVFSGIDFDTGHALYSKYNTKMTNQETMTAKTEITGQSSNAGYIYYHWTLDGRYPQDAINAGHAINVYVERTHGPNPDGYTYTLFHAFEVNSILSPTYGATNSNDKADLTGDGIYSTCYVSAHNLAQYVSYWWFITEIHQQPYTKYQRIFTFTRETTESLESTTPVTEGDDITNIRHYVKYGF